jgi:predicted DNA-binding transcriptional regulator AlpA
MGKEDTKLTFREWCDLVGSPHEQDRVMSIKEWAKTTGISDKTARNLIEENRGPPTVQLSDNRIGVRVSDHRTWLANRVRPAYEKKGHAATDYD